MGLLDRIGKALKPTSKSEPAPPKAPETAAATSSSSAGKAADAPATTKGLFGEPAAEPTAKSTAGADDQPTPGTKGLFGAPDADATTAAPKAEKSVDAPSTKGLFGGEADTAAQQDVAAQKQQSDGPTSSEPTPDPQARQIKSVFPKVLMIVHNPPVPSEGGKRLTEVFKWHDPDKLAKGYIEDLKKVSGGYLSYEIVDRIDADIFPPKTDGFAYSADEYVKVMRGEAKAHDPDWLDYHKRIETFDLQNRFLNGDFDEVWVFSFPYAGEYESIMGGPGGFWCNAPAIENTERFKRRFVMMGFNMERGVDCMLENFGHRTESIMTELYKRRGKKQDMWKLFTQYEKQNPGNAQCGWMHYAPNSVKDYDWGNKTKVESFCDDWFTYPELPGVAKTMDNTTWGGGDMRAHHLWWYEHIPKVTGETDGISNNWWEYIVLARQVDD